VFPLRSSRAVDARQAGPADPASWHPAARAAQGATPVAPVDATVETLVDIQVEGLPADEAEVWAERMRMRPGPAPVERAVPEQEPSVLAVEAGEVVFSAGGTDRRLRAGDQLVIPAGQAYAYRNAGPGEALVVTVAFPAGPFVGSEWDESQAVVEALVPPFSADLAGGAARVVLDRLALPPGAELAAEAGPIEGYGVERGTLGVTLAGDALPYGWEAGVERSFGVGTMPRLIRPGTPMTLRNAGDGPLIVYRIRVSASPAGRTPVAATPAP
jgi:quercetin dioxygenase-like cupin family protein